MLGFWFSRFVNAFRRWSEDRDRRLLVEQWKSAFKPEPKKVRLFINLRVVRSASKRRVA